MFDIIDPLTTVNYDEMLLSTPGASFFHTSAWARVLVESYRYKPVYFAQISNDRISTLVPMMDVRSVLTGKRGVSLPFTDYCEPITPANGDYTELLENTHKIRQEIRLEICRIQNQPENESRYSGSSYAFRPCSEYCK